MADTKISRRTKLRMLGGFVAVPPAIAVLGFFVFLLLEIAGMLAFSGRISDAPGAAVGVGLAVGILAFLMVVGGALPLVLSASERGPLELRRLLKMGVVLGNVPLALIIVGATLVNLAAGTLERGRELYFIGPNLIRVAIGSLVGLAGAAIFWFVGVRGSELDADAEPLPAAPSEGRSWWPRG